MKGFFKGDGDVDIVVYILCLYIYRKVDINTHLYMLYALHTVYLLHLTWCVFEHVISLYIYVYIHIQILYYVHIYPRMHV